MNQGSEPWRQTPEKSGTDAAPGVAVWIGATAGAAVCPNAGGVTETTNKNNKRKSRCIAMAISLSGSPIASRVRAHCISIAVRVRGMPRVCGHDLSKCQKPGQNLEAKLVGKVHVSSVLFRRAGAMLIRAWRRRETSTIKTKKQTSREDRCAESLSRYP